MEMKALTGLKMLVAAFAAPLVLSACHEDEQGRVLTYQPGVYLGKPDTPLSAGQVRELRYRALFLSRLASYNGGSVIGFPSPSTLDLAALRRRGLMQGGMK